MTTRASLLPPAALPLCALALGLLADVLLRADPWGVNVPLGIIPFIVALAWFHARSRTPLAAGWHWTLAACAAAALLTTWRSSPTLQMLNLLFLLGALGTSIARPALGALRTASLADLAHAGLVYGVHAVVGPVFLLVNDLRRPAPAPLNPRLAPRLAKGAVLALPPLALFAALFMAADPVFSRDVHAVLDVDFPSLASHVLLSGAVAWIIAGFLRGRFLAEPVPFQFNNIPDALHLGIAELGVVLGTLIVLFAAFLAVQFRYLFGGASLVEVAPGLTWARYARSGFFELVTAAGVVLPFLLLAQWLFVPLKKSERVIFRILALVLIGLVFVLMASALRRMLLYQQEFGLTEARFLATAFMAWLALMLLCFVATALRGRRDLFVSTGFAVSFLLLLALNAANPADWIVRTNLARAAEGKPFDASYNALLADDALPALLQGLPALKEADRRTVIHKLDALASRLDRSDWRSWTVSRSNARALLVQIPLN